MATRGTINELYDLQSLESQQKAVLDFVSQYVNAVKTASAIKIQLGGANSAKDITAAIKQLNIEQQKLADLQFKLAKAETEYAKARLNSNKADTEAVKTKKQQIELENKLNSQKEKLIKQAEKEAKAIEKANNEYIKLNDQYKAASAASLKRGAELLKGANGNEALFQTLLKTDKEYLATTKSAKTYNDQLLLLEQNVGRSQRNVGNYASAFNGLNTSFARLAQELPSLNVSFQTFALAISNNLPIAAEEISKARAEIARLKAEGLQAPSLFQQITKSLLSFQVGLSIGITLFVMYSKQISEFVSSLFATKKAFDATAESAGLVNKALESSEFTNAVKNVNELKINIKLAKEGLLDKKKVLDQYNESLGKTTGEVKTLDEAEQALTKNGPAYIQMMLFKAAANLALEDAAKKAFQAEQLRRKKEEEFVNKFTDTKVPAFGSTTFNPREFEQDQKRREEALQKRKKQAVDAAQSESDALLNIAESFQKQAADISSKFKFDFFGGDGDKKGKGNGKDIAAERKKISEDELAAQRELILIRIQDQINFTEKIIENDQQAYQKRIDAANQFYDLSRLLLEKELEFELADIDKKAKEAGVGEEKVQQQKLLVRAKYNTKLIELEQKNADQISSIVKGQVDKDTRARIEAYEKQLKAINDAGSIEISLLQKQRDEELLALSEKAKATGMSYEAQQKERLAIVAKYAKLELEAQLKKLEELAKLETDPVKKAALEQQIAAIRLKIDDELTAEKIKNLKEVEDAEKKLAELQKQLAQEVFTLAKTFVLGRFDAAKNSIQDQIEKIDEQKRTEIDYINATTTDAVEKQARISNAEKKAQNERERLELRQRQLDRQRAQYERAFSIAQIIWKTSEAVIKVLPNIPLSILMGAIGAAQLATVLAQPIPRFKTGKGAYDDYEGPAWVGDGGKSEMIFREDGSIERTPATPVMTWVGKNDIIHPDADALLNKTLQKQGEVYPYDMAAMWAFGEMTNTMKTGFNQIEKAIVNKREWIVNLNNGKPSIMSKDGTRLKTYLNDNLQFGK